VTRVLLHRSGRVATLTLNRPEAGNRLDGALLDELAGHLRALTGEAPVVVVRGAGADFSLGREPAAHGRVPRPDAVVAEFDRVQAVNRLVQDFPGVSVAVVRGRAYGAGASLAGRCDLVVAADDATLAFPEVPMGIAPTVVASYFAHRLPRTALLDLILTGREVGAAEARELGLVSRVVPAAELNESVERLVEHLAGLDAEIVRTVKEFLGRVDRMRPDDAVRYGIAVLANQIVDRALRAEEGSKR
jgi:enoyl-CoA hydratase/carnithine racemase